MVVDLNAPDSILAWWKVWPARHDSFLDFHLKANPQFACAIREVQRLIATDPELSAMLVAGVWEQGSARMPRCALTRTSRLIS